MGLRHTSVRMAAAASLCVGALLTLSGPALAAPGDDDTILPAEGQPQPRAQNASNPSDLQGFLNSLTQSWNDTFGRQLDAARETAIQQTNSNLAVSIATPIANGATGIVSGAASGAASGLFYLLAQNLVGSPASSASTFALPAASTLALPAASAWSLPAFSAPAMPVGFPQLPPPPAIGLPQVPAIGLPQLPPPPPIGLPQFPAIGLPQLPPPPPIGLPQLPPIGLPELPPPPPIGFPQLPPPPSLPCIIFCLPKLF